MKNCPTCQSDQVKKASLIFAEGTGVAAGVGIGTGGIGAGGGASASTLAVKCAPPKQVKKISYRLGLFFIFWFVPLMIAMQGLASIWDIGFFWKIWAVAGFLVGAGIYGRAETEASRVHNLAIAEYEKTFMCLRCGAFYKPFE